MNERFRELAEQVDIIKRRNVSTRRPEISGRGWDYTMFHNQFEDFAKLIVKECANVAANHDALDIYEKIREHFGVEE